jgi:hypothetical protein
MEYEIRLYKCAPQGIFGEHGQWEIWECVDGEWEHIPDEVYSYIDSEDKENQMLQAEFAMHRLMTVVERKQNENA